MITTKSIFLISIDHQDDGNNEVVCVASSKIEAEYIISKLKELNDYNIKFKDFYYEKFETHYKINYSNYFTDKHYISLSNAFIKDNYNPPKYLNFLLDIIIWSPYYLDRTFSMSETKLIIMPDSLKALM